MVTPRSSLFTEPKFSDITIVCIKREFKVHKNILAMRSTWFEKKCSELEANMSGKIDLQSEPTHLVEAMLKYIYSSALDPAEFGLKKGSFTKYVELIQVASRFELEKTMGADALNLLGQYCDEQLVKICSYDSALCKRGDGVLDVETDPVLVNKKFMPDLIRSLELAYKEDGRAAIKDILLGFVWASRAHVLQCRHQDRVPAAASAPQADDAYASVSGTTDNTVAAARREAELDLHQGCFHGLSLEVPQFAGDFFRLMVGNGTGNSWVPAVPRNGTMDPGSVATYNQSFAMDHKRKTQHPDRCLGCRLVFGEGETIKAVYNPFYVQARPTAYCYECVTKNEGLVMWREVVDEEETDKEVKKDTK